MRLDDLNSLLTPERADLWEVLVDGPTYRFQAYGVGPEHSGGLELQEHHSVATFREDIAITMAWGMRTRTFSPREEANPLAWAPFPDQTVRFQLVDVFYCGALVHRQGVASVDGGRAVLPVPAIDGADYVVTEAEVAVAELVDILSGGGEFHEYLRQSGMTVRPY